MKRVVRPYVGLRNGPGCPRSVRGILASFRGGVKHWGSAYLLAGGGDRTRREELVLPRWRFGPFKWGLHLVEARS